MEQNNNSRKNIKCNSYFQKCFEYDLSDFFLGSGIFKIIFFLYYEHLWALTYHNLKSCPKLLLGAALCEILCWKLTILLCRNETCCGIFWYRLTLTFIFWPLKADLAAVIKFMILLIVKISCQGNKIENYKKIMIGPYPMVPRFLFFWELQLVRVSYFLKKT